MSKKQTTRQNDDDSQKSSKLNQKDTDRLKQSKDRAALNKIKLEELDISKRILENEQAIQDIVAKRRAAEAAYKDISKQLADHRKAMTAEEKKSGSLQEQILKRYKKQAKYESKSAELAEEGLRNQKKSLEAALKHIKALRDATEAAQKLVNKYDQFLEPFDQIDKWLKSVPGGETISEILGIDKIGDRIKENIIERLAEGQAAGKGMVASLGPLLPLLVAAGLLMKAFQFDKQLTQFSKDLDVAKGDAANIASQANLMAANLGMAGIAGEQMQASMVAIREEFGYLGTALNQDLVEGVTMLRERMGLTNEEALKLNSTATLLHTNLDELASSSMMMSEGLISNRQMLKEMSKLPASMVVGFKGTQKELQKAVIKGKLLGLELTKVSQISEGLLDIESSIEKEMTANVLTGKHMNLNAARQYALTGDVSNLQQELLHQAGGLAEYQKMAPYQQKAFAAAMGMTVDEMTNMLTKAQQLEDVGLNESKVNEILLANAEKQSELMSGMNDKQQKYLGQLIEQKKQEEATAKFQTAMNRLMGALSKIMLPIVDLLGTILGYVGSAVDKITMGLEYLNGWINPMEESRGIMFEILRLVSLIGIGMLAWKVGKGLLGKAKEKVGGFLGDNAGSLLGKKKDTPDISGASGQADKAKSLADKFKGISESVKSFFDIIRSAVQGIMGIITDVFKGVGEAIAGFFKAFQSISYQDLIKGALALGIMAGSLWLMSKALESFANIGWDDLGKAALTLAGLAAVVGVLGAPPIVGFIYAGSLALGVMSAAFWLFGKAAESVASAMPAIAAGFKSFGDIDGVNLLKVAAGITALSGALVLYGAGSALSGIGSALGKLFDEDPVEKFNRFAAIDAVKLSAVAAAILAMGDAIRSFSSAVSSIGDTSPIIDTIDKVMKLHDALTESAGDKILNGITEAVTGVFTAATNWVASVPKVEGVAQGNASNTAPVQNANQGSLSEVAGLLKELIAKIEQPVKINIDGRVIDVLESQASMRRSYNTKIDGAYGVNG